jgi:hypothetical protein
VTAVHYFIGGRRCRAPGGEAARSHRRTDCTGPSTHQRTQLARPLGVAYDGLGPKKGANAQLASFSPVG